MVATISVLRNTTTGGVLSFEKVRLSEKATAHDGISVGDIDGDGKPDVVVSELSRRYGVGIQKYERAEHY